MWIFNMFCNREIMTMLAKPVPVISPQTSKTNDWKTKLFLNPVGNTAKKSLPKKKDSAMLFVNEIRNRKSLGAIAKGLKSFFQARFQPRSHGAFPWLWRWGSKAREKRPRGQVWHDSNSYPVPFSRRTCVSFTRLEFPLTEKIAHWGDRLTPERCNSILQNVEERENGKLGSLRYHDGDSGKNVAWN